VMWLGDVQVDPNVGRSHYIRRKVGQETAELGLLPLVRRRNEEASHSPGGASIAVRWSANS